MVVALDDADGRILYARFFPQAGTASTFAALEAAVEIGPKERLQIAVGALVIGNPVPPQFLWQAAASAQVKGHSS
jgi:hypothetical protein